MSYGCYNRPDFVDSYTVYGISKTTAKLVCTNIPFRMSRACEYQKDDKYADPGCVGCKHKETHENR